MIDTIVKRDGREMPFESDKIAQAVRKAFEATGQNKDEKTCAKITSGECDKGILICGTGIGISISANKIKGIRAALCQDYYTAKYTRLHNDANVLCMGGRVIGPGTAEEIVRVFLSTEFEGGRHAARVDKMMALENK